MDKAVPSDPGPGKRRATLRRGPASLTATAGAAPVHRRRGRAGEGAR
ncbi:DUF6380 family protein [Streptomyces mangrovisoli]